MKRSNKSTGRYIPSGKGPVHALLDYDSIPSLHAQLRDEKMNPLGAFKPKYRVSMFEPVGPPNKKPPSESECNLSVLR